MSDLELTMMRRVGELKAEVERLKKFNEEAMAHIAKEERKSRERLEMAEDENARLKADVNELADGLKLASEVGIKMADEVTRLKAEVERLTKAGDNLVYVVTEHPVAEPFVKAWFTAKEGKQP
jgi:predicted nuclease with TOPRIM domain